MKKWILKSSKPVYESKWISLYDREYEIPNGETHSNYMHVVRGDYVLVVAIDAEDNIVMEYHYRRATDDFYWEVPAGGIDKGETPEEAALRELKEETGYSADVIRTIQVDPQPGFIKMKAYVVFCKLKGQKSQPQREIDEEEMIVKNVTLDEVREMFTRGEIRDMGSTAAVGLFLASL